MEAVGQLADLARGADVEVAEEGDSGGRGGAQSGGDALGQDVTLEREHDPAEDGIAGGHDLEALTP